jgi:hypothetical protein
MVYSANLFYDEKLREQVWSEVCEYKTLNCDCSKKANAIGILKHHYVRMIFETKFGSLPSK